MDEALGEGGDTCVVVLICMRVSYASAKYLVTRSWRGGEDALSTPARKLIAEPNVTSNKRVPQAPYSWTGRINAVRVQVLIPVSPHTYPTSILSTTHLHLLLRDPTCLSHPNYERTR